jgi:hypothetical protein
MGDGQGFIVDVIVKICFPFDGVPLCVPTEDGLHLLKNQEIPIFLSKAMFFCNSFSITS